MQKSFATFNAEGFTLIELMVTLAVAGIVLALAVPSLRSILGGTGITATTNEFVSSIHTARSEAVKRGSRVGLCPSANSLATDAVCSTSATWSDGWFVFVDANEDGDRDDPGDELLLQMEARSPGFTFTSAGNVLANLIYFSADGKSITAADLPVTGTVSVEYGDENVRAITVSASGRVSTKEIIEVSP